MQHYKTHNPEIDFGEKSRFNRFPFFSPRIWHGMEAKDWFRLLRGNRYRFDRWWNFTYITMFCGLNTTLNAIQKGLLGRRIEETPIQHDPVFVLGHWRSGTTLLHNLLAQDKRYWAPTTFQCFAPKHFILSEQILPRLLYLPRRRPMDNIRLAWDQPQECEFALCASGLPSVYRNLAFPNNSPRHLDYLNMRGIPAAELDVWKSAYMEFVKALNYWKQRPIVLKSPTNTGRIQVLLDMFPNAKFIHITRTPYDFIPSTIYLWEALCYSSSMQSDTGNFDAAEYVFDCYARMYGGFESQRHLIPAGNFHQIRFEHLVRSPVETLEGIYEQLDLGDFGEVRENIEQSMERQKEYKRNRHNLSTLLRHRIAENCQNYLRTFDYGEELAAA